MKCKIKLILLVCTALTVASPAFSQYDDYDDYDDYDEGYDYGGETAWFTLKQVAHPWYFGIIGGFTQNTLYMGGAENYRPTQKWVGSNGGTIALAARYQIFNWLAVQAEPTYITKNYSSKWVGVYEGKAYDNITNGFVDFPLLVNLSAGWGSGNGVFRVFANVGGFAGFWAHGRGDGVEPVMPNLNPIYGQGDDFYAYDTSYEFDDRRDNRFDGGLLFGGGIQYDTNAFSIIAEFRYSYSLTDLQKKYQSVDFVPQMNDTWMLTAGVLFNPGIFFGGK